MGELQISLAKVADQIPAMEEGHVAVLVETQVRWEPFIWAGIGVQTMEDFVITRTRYAPQIVYENPDGTLIRYLNANEA